MSLPTILALDPGGTTGCCLYRSEHDIVEIEQLGPHEHHQELWDMLGATLAESLEAKRPLHVVCEAFEFRQTERHRDYIEYISREYIGVAKLFCQLQHVKFFLQSPMNVIGDRAFFNDDKVKKLSLWVSGRRHAMDATRHYLYHRTFTLGDQSILHKLK